MEYIVLARKYRPSSFKEVVGQEHITQVLASALTNSRLAQAFCLTGPRGVGKTSVARILAKAVNCEKGPTANPCGKCVYCCGINQNVAIDIQEIDAASFSRVEDIRELRETIRYQPQTARYRVIILDEVHMLSKAAFNALLKTLEEPPQHVIFILATTDVYKVPLTILSRCQRYDFRRVSLKKIVDFLKDILVCEGVVLVPEALFLIAREADGSIRDALSYLDQLLSSGRSQINYPEAIELLGFVNRELVRNAIEAVLSGNTIQLLNVVAQFYTSGGELQAFYVALEEYFRNLVIAKSTTIDAEFLGLTKEEISDLRIQGQEISIETLHEYFDLLARSEDIFRRATQPRLVIEMILLKITQIKPVLSLEKIIERLRQVSKNEDDILMKADNNLSTTTFASLKKLKPKLKPIEISNKKKFVQEQFLSNSEQFLQNLANYVIKIEPTLGYYLERASCKFNKDILVITLPYSPLATDLVGPESEAKLNFLANELWEDMPPLQLLVKTSSVKLLPKIIKCENNKINKDSVIQEVIEVFDAEVISDNSLKSD